MKRQIEKNLQEWKKSEQRKPLILRGARQVGKTYSVRDFAKSFTQLTEINFERNNAAISIFEGDLDPKRIVRDLAILTKKPIEAGKTLLFLDEIQVCPRSIAALRYFYEEMPELHIIAAGSLIEFALDQHGVPVGRVAFMQIHPMSFMEFLGATESDLLVNAVMEHSEAGRPMPDHLHEMLVKKVATYFAVGGMPESVRAWRDTQDLATCQSVQAEIIDAYRQDFRKYAKTQQIKYVDLLFDNLANLLGEKFKFSKISTHFKARELAPCLDLLEKAGIVHYVTQTNAQHPPLGAGKKPQHFKIILLDVGLTQDILGLDKGDWILNPKQALENTGSLVEAFVGQELLAYTNPEKKGQLYYWNKDKGSSKAEVDYVIQKGEKLVPIEVKSGITGGLKSLLNYVASVEGCESGIHFSQRPYEENNGYTSMPLYSIKKALTP